MLFEALSLTCSAILPTIWRPGLKYVLSLLLRSLCVSLGLYLPSFTAHKGVFFLLHNVYNLNMKSHTWIFYFFIKIVFFKSNTSSNKHSEKDKNNLHVWFAMQVICRNIENTSEFYRLLLHNTSSNKHSEKDESNPLV